MKNQLLTLEAERKRLDQDKTTSAEYKWDQLGTHAFLMGVTLKLKYFVACGEDGKPIEEPDPHNYFDACQKEDELKGEDLKGHGIFLGKLKAYEKALGLIIFLGFEVQENQPDSMYENIENGKVHLVFGKESIAISVFISDTIWTDFEYIQAFAQLAAATSENPLPIK